MAFLSFYNIFQIAGNISLWVFVVFLFVKRKETCGDVIRLITSCTIMMQNVMCVKQDLILGDSLMFDAVIADLWLIIAITCAHSICKRQNENNKEEK